jgi:hypothetical protein
MGFARATFPGHLCIFRFPGRARVSGPVLGCRAEIFDHRTAQDFPIGDFLRNGPYIVQNGPLGVSEKGPIRVVWEKEPLGFPTGLARDHHAPVSAFLSHAPSSNQQPFLEFFSPFFTKNSPFFPFLSLLGPWPPPVMIPTPW